MAASFSTWLFVRTGYKRSGRAPIRSTGAAVLTFSSKQWRKDHPFGFFAKPARTHDNILDLKNWECGIPGKDKTIWDGGLFKLTITFPEGRRDDLILV